MNCQFCQQKCKQALFDDDPHISAWYDCRSCNVGYRTYCKNGKVELIRYYATLKGRSCCLDLDVTVNQTEILLLPIKPDDTIVIVMILPYIIEGITPDNVQSKLETYVTFS